MALDRDNAVPIALVQIVENTFDIPGVHTAADGHLRTADPRLFTTNGRCQGFAHIFDVAVHQVLAEPLAVLERVESRDE